METVASNLAGRRRGTVVAIGLTVYDELQLEQRSPTPFRAEQGARSSGLYIARLGTCLERFDDAIT